MTLHRFTNTRFPLRHLLPLTVLVAALVYSSFTEPNPATRRRSEQIARQQEKAVSHTVTVCGHEALRLGMAVHAFALSLMGGVQ